MTVIEEIAEERRRQINVEGWTPDHDDHHISGEIAQAAAVYALPPQKREVEGGYWTGGGRDPEFSRWVPPVVRFWPWDISWWKPKDRRHDLIRAAALIVAEIERLDRGAHA